MRRQGNPALRTDNQTATPINVGAGPGNPAAVRHRRGATGAGRALGQQPVGGGTSYNLLAGIEPGYAPLVGQLTKSGGDRANLATGDGGLRQSVGVGVGLDRNDGDLAALGVAPASLLTLPLLSADVPHQIDLSTDDNHDRATALIAQALIDGKMLLDDDHGWAGNLADSVTLGLRERLAAYGAESLGFFGTWRLIWTDDVREMQLLPKANYGERILAEPPSSMTAATMPLGLYTPSERIVGGFAIASMSGAREARTDEAQVGLGVEWLISQVGRATGWRIWRVFQTALDVAGIAITPALLRKFAVSCWGEDYDDPDWEREKTASDFDLMTPGRMDSSIPWQASEFMRESDPRLLRRAKGDYRRRIAAIPESDPSKAITNAVAHALAETSSLLAIETRPDLAARCLEITAHLGTVIERRFRGVSAEDRPRYYLSHLSQMMPSIAISSRAVRWSHYDTIPRRCDDYVHSHDELAGISCLLSFVLDAEESGAPGGIDWAVRSLRDLITIVVGCDELVAILHASDEDHDTGGVWPLGTTPGKHPPRPPQEPRSTLLIDILGSKGTDDSPKETLCTL